MTRSITLLIASLVTLCASALNAVVEPYAETCGNSNGKIYSYAFGGLAPYTFSWTGPNGFTSAADSIYDLTAGTYELTVTDALADISVRVAVVEDLSSLPYSGEGTYAGASEVTGSWGGACIGQCNGAMAMALFEGTPPYSYSFSVNAEYLGTTTYGHPVYGGFCLGQEVSYVYSDALGCQGEGWFTVYGVDASWFPVIDAITGSCSGSAGGSMRFSTGLTGFTSEHQLWTDGQLVTSVPGGLGVEVVIDDLAPGDYELRTSWNFTECSDSQFFTVPDLGMGCGTLNGNSWYDVDQDCILDAGEVGIPNSVLAIEPGGYYALTRNDGSFSLDLPDGNYTLTLMDPTLLPICPPAQPVPIIMNGTPVNIELANGSTQELDLDVWMTSTAARPGFDHRLYARVRNTSPQISGPVTATVTYDPAMTYLSSQPTPTTEVGNTLIWEWPAFSSFETRSVQLNFNIPVSTPLGMVLSSSLSATNTLPETNTTNNTEVEQRTVSGSYDPNDKTARTSSRASDEMYIINSDEYIDYTIQFQNTGTDTAFTVVITDTLSSDFDMGSFQQGVCSHPCTMNFKAGRVVEWTFSNILLPDSNTNEGASHGLASFRIKLNEPVFPGSEIENTANIFFDFNSPVITEPSVLVAEFSTGLTDGTRALAGGLAPNPANDRVRLLDPQRAANTRKWNLSAADGRNVAGASGPFPADGIAIEGLRSGLYVLHLFTEQGELTEPLIKISRP